METIIRVLIKIVVIIMIFFFGYGWSVDYESRKDAATGVAYIMGTFFTAIIFGIITFL